MTTRFKAWWHRTTHGGKYQGLALATLGGTWSFAWFAVMYFLIPEPQGEHPLYLPLYWVCLAGVIAGLIGVAWHAVESVDRLDQ
jgi:hypothetical protein